MHTHALYLKHEIVYVRKLYILLILKIYFHKTIFAFYVFRRLVHTQFWIFY